MRVFGGLRTPALGSLGPVSDAAFPRREWGLRTPALGSLGPVPDAAFPRREWS
jgi:hypothetical protein